jgi:hypothetical protein
VLARAGDSFKVNFTTSCVRKRFSSRATGWAVDRCSSSWIAALAQSAVEDRFRRNSTDKLCFYCFATGIELPQMAVNHKSFLRWWCGFSRRARRNTPKKAIAT